MSRVIWNGFFLGYISTVALSLSHNNLYGYFFIMFIYFFFFSCYSPSSTAHESPWFCHDVAIEFGLHQVVGAVAVVVSYSKLVEKTQSWDLKTRSCVLFCSRGKMDDENPLTMNFFCCELSATSIRLFFSIAITSRPSTQKKHVKHGATHN